MEVRAFVIGEPLMGKKNLQKLTKLAQYLCFENVLPKGVFNPFPEAKYYYY